MGFSTGSVVVPAVGETMETSWRVRAFRRLDLPTLRRPKMPDVEPEAFGCALHQRPSSGAGGEPRRHTASGAREGVELLGREEPGRDGLVTEAPARRARHLAQTGGALVPEGGDEGRERGGGGLHVAGGTGPRPPRAPRRSGERRMRQARARRSQVPRRQSATSGRKGLSSRVPMERGRGDDLVVAHGEEGGLGDRLGDDGVDLARHDGGARLPCGEADLAEPRLRARGHEAQVAADLDEAHGEGLEDPRDLHEHVGVLGAVQEVLGPRKPDARHVA